MFFFFCCVLSLPGQAPIYMVAAGLMVLGRGFYFFGRVHTDDQVKSKAAVVRWKE